MRFEARFFKLFFGFFNLGSAETSVTFFIGNNNEGNDFLLNTFRRLYT